MIALIRWAAFFGFIACMTAFFAGYRSAGLALVALVLFVIVALTCGMTVVFTRRFWFGTPEGEAECARADAELEAIERAYR